MDSHWVSCVNMQGKCIPRPPLACPGPVPMLLNQNRVVVVIISYMCEESQLETRHATMLRACCGSCVCDGVRRCAAHWVAHAGFLVL